MKKYSNFVLNNKYYFIVGVIVLVAVLFLVSGKKDKTETYTVIPVTVEQSIILSGDVRTGDRADLGFASSGRINKIYVENNQEVRAGQVLAQLEIGELLADLKIKQVNLNTSEVDLEGAKENLDKLISLEDTKIESARRKLLSDGLTFTPSSSTYTVTPPTITGAYSGMEGRYKVSIEKENVTSSDYILRTFDIEKTIVDVNEEGPTKLGTKGLYISLSDSLDLYHDTIWYLDIPNKASSAYFANLSAYNEAKQNKEKVVKQAETDYKKLLSGKDNSQSLVTQAEIDKINAEIRKNTIYAPFSGKVTNIEKVVGENASTGDRVISLLGEGRLEIVLKVSELDVSRILPESKINISFDALPGEIFVGTLNTINSKETKVDGVPVYEAFVGLEADPRIKSGMSANGSLTLMKKENVLAIPKYLVGEDSKVKVLLLDGKTEERSVSVGLEGTDSMIEILAGLNEGEKVLVQ
ncbi:MAG: efflux RND transporter periplasmic adaptor subunit [Candidatus Pacebacteria bacterium]|nr:efflux RND transporter periplasmic adaptor subunit [Candidatus Paceibacterota bacterium]MCF7863140.1 efflux RND transporter periplasmic adaptor subunit [Candidatus Paceibacterota bacterium]